MELADHSVQVRVPASECTAWLGWAGGLGGLGRGKGGGGGGREGGGELCNLALHSKTAGSEGFQSFGFIGIQTSLRLRNGSGGTAFEQGYLPACPVVGRAGGCKPLRVTLGSRDAGLLSVCLSHRRLKLSLLSLSPDLT